MNEKTQKYSISNRKRKVGTLTFAIIIGLILALASEGLAQESPLMVSTAPPRDITNNGTGIAYISWNVPYGFTSTQYDLRILRDQTAIDKIRTYTTNDQAPRGTLRGQEQWTVPSGISEGKYYAQLIINSKEANGPDLYIEKAFLVGPPAGLFIYKFKDINNDSIRSSNEPGLVGWEFEISGPREGPEIGIEPSNLTIKTDASGSIHIPDLFPGTYTVRELTSMPGWYSTTGTEKSAVVMRNDTSTIYFGNNQFGHLRITAFDDINVNRKNDQEPGLSQWEFTLEPTSSNKIFTGSDGNAIIELAPGQYRVTEIQKPGWKATTKTEQIVIIKPGEDAEVQFGNVKTSILNITKFEDINQNGMPNADEPHLANWEFTVRGPEINQTILTGEGGSVEVELLPGTYMVKEKEKEGWISTTEIEQRAEMKAGEATKKIFGNIPKTSLNIMSFYDGNANRSYDAGEAALQNWSFIIDGNLNVTTGSDGFVRIDLPAGKHIIKEILKQDWINTTPIEQQMILEPHGMAYVYFGNRIPQKIIKFFDRNNDQIKELDETGLPGWNFLIKGDGVNITKETNSSGVIVLKDLRPGRYEIKESMNPNWYNTTSSLFQLTIPGEDLYIGNDLYRNLTINKFNDSNRNGVQDSAEPGLSGWEFQISDFSDKVYTGINGDVTVKVRANRTYVISESLPTRWDNSTPTVVSKFIDPKGESFSVAFGDYLPKPPVINITAYLDRNSNGIKEQGEKALGNWSFWVTDPNGYVQKVTTNETGNVEFQGSVAGMYIVEEIISGHACWYNTTPIVVARDMAAEQRAEIEFGNNQSIQRCDCISPPEERTQKLRLDTENVTVYKIIDPSVISSNLINQKNGTVINYTFAVCVKPKIMPTDMVLAIDTSGSFIESGSGTLNGISNGMARFINEKKTSSDRNFRIGLVSWDDDIDASISPTTNFTSLLNGAKGLKANFLESTNYSVGMKGALKAFDNSSSPSSKKVIVFITDANGEFKPFLNYSKDSGEYTIHSIIIGPIKVKETYSMLEAMTNKYNGSLITIEDPSTLDSELENLANMNLEKREIKDVRIIDTLPSYLKPQGYFGERPIETINQDGIKWRTRTYQWNISNISSDECWTSGISAIFCGRLPADLSLLKESPRINSEVDYTEEGNIRKAIELPEGTIWIVPGSGEPSGSRTRTPGFEAWALILGMLAAVYVMKRR
jgi:hypothetical protein